MDNFNSNMFNSNIHIVDIKEVKTDPSNLNEFLDDLSITLLKYKIDATVSCGVNMSSEELLSYKNKDKTLKILTSIIKNLKGINDSDKNALLDMFYIGIDLAEQSFICVLEFSKYTTNVTLIAEPANQINQRTLHSNNRFIKNYRFRATHSLFEDLSIDVVNSIFYDLTNISSDGRFLANEKLKKYFESITNKNINKNVAGVKILLSENHALREKQVEMLLHIKQTFFTDDQPEQFTMFNMEYNTLRSNVKPYCYLN